MKVSREALLQEVVLDLVGMGYKVVFKQALRGCAGVFDSGSMEVRVAAGERMLEVLVHEYCHAITSDNRFNKAYGKAVERFAKTRRMRDAVVIALDELATEALAVSLMRDRLRPSDYDFDALCQRANRNIMGYIWQAMGVGIPFPAGRYPTKLVTEKDVHNPEPLLSYLTGRTHVGEVKQAAEDPRRSPRGRRARGPSSSKGKNRGGSRGRD